MRRIIIVLMLAFLLITYLLEFNASAFFSDVLPYTWYAESVQYMSDHSLMNGVGNNRFDPNGTVTRGMLVTILHRLDGADETVEKSAFEDVPVGSYYEDAINWAAAHGIVGGYSRTQFGPNDSITREQLATILYRYSSYKGFDVSGESTLSAYNDVAEINDYAMKAMRWAEAVGIINGVGNGKLGPQMSASRAQVATMVMRFDRANTTGAEIKTYEVTFRDYDGTVLKSEMVKSGENATPPEMPIRKDYTFVGWDGNYLGVTSDESVIARYKKTEDAQKKEDIPQDADESDDDTTAILVDRVTASAGDKKVDLSVSVKNNPGILGMTLTVSYDEQNLKLLKAESGSAVNDVLTFVPAKSLKSGSSFVWYGTDLSAEQIKDGTILTLTFEVSETAKGTLPIVLTTVSGDIVNSSLQTVNAQLQSGSIQIK